MSPFSPQERWRLRRELVAYYNLLRHPRPRKRRLLIFAQGRTGTTLLESLLASTGHFEGKGEVLGANHERVRFPIAYMKGLSRKFPHENIVCHVKIYHLGHDRLQNGARPVEPARFLAALRKDGWDIVTIRRADKFEHYVSGCIARARGAYHKLDDRDEEIRVRIDRADLERGMLNRHALDLREAEALARIPHLPLQYETDLKLPEMQQATIARVLSRLGLEQRPAKTALKKINARPGAGIIVNYDEAREWAEEIEASRRLSPAASGDLQQRLTENEPNVDKSATGALR